MNKNHFVKVHVFVLSLIAVFSAARNLFPCSTFLLKKGNVLLVGHNLDERSHIPGLVFINKRKVMKTAVSWMALTSGKPDQTPPLSWTSKYASVTFNVFGRDFPDDGMNEAGLFIGEMTLAESKFPEDGMKPRIFMSLWMQYVLDNFESVDQVIESASAVVIDGWGWHFFVADRAGNAASLEFLDGKLVVHTGNAMTFPILCNATFEQEMERLKLYKGFGGEKPLSLEDKETPRFVQAAFMLENFSPSAKPAVDYAFDILRQLERGGTQWSLVCDLRNLKAWFRTAPSPKIKQVELKAFDLDCPKPVKYLNIHSDLAGDVSKVFQDHSSEVSKDFARQALDAILKISADFEKLVTLRGGTMEGLIERFISYSDKSKCLH